jgi:calcineurin-like phosphoesterase family protein
MSKRFFTSDLHLMHANIILHCGRPWLREGDLGPDGRWVSQEIKMARAIEMTDALVENWNSVIGDNDEVWVLGDFMMNTNVQRINDNLSRLRGTKHLIVGNHDPNIGKCKSVPGWTSVSKSIVIEVGGRSVLMEHRKVFPFDTDWMFHGHSHRTTNIMSGQGGRAIDIGIDGHGYMPYLEDDLVALMDKKDSSHST